MKVTRGMNLFRPGNIPVISVKVIIKMKMVVLIIMIVTYNRPIK